MYWLTYAENLYRFEYKKINVDTTTLFLIVFNFILIIIGVAYCTYYLSNRGKNIEKSYEKHKNSWLSKIIPSIYSKMIHYKRVFIVVCILIVNVLILLINIKLILLLL